MVRKLHAKIAKIKHGLDQLFVCLDSGLRHRGLDFRIGIGGLKDGKHLRITRFFARHWRRVLEDCRIVVEEFLRDDPLDFLIAGRRCRGDGQIAPIRTFHRTVIFCKRVSHDLAQYALDSLRSSGVSSMKMRALTEPLLVVARNTLVIPLGVSPVQLGPTSR